MPTQTRSGLYSAEALQRLRLIPRGSLVLMNAPWGFGKSALLSAWEQTLGGSGLLRVALSPRAQRPHDVLNQLTPTLLAVRDRRRRASETRPSCAPSGAAMP